MSVFIRRVQAGDGPAFAYIQTESWKAAFQNILDQETLDRCTDIGRAAGYLAVTRQKLIQTRSEALDAYPNRISETVLRKSKYKLNKSH